MSNIMTKKNKNKEDIKLEIPKNLLAEKSIIDKFAPECQSVDNKASEKKLDGVFLDDKELFEYMDSVIKGKMRESARSKAKQMDEVFKTLDHVMPEFYQNCMIFGFNALGEKTVYMYAPTEKDKEALFHHVKSTVYNMGGHD